MQPARLAILAAALAGAAFLAAPAAADSFLDRAREAVQDAGKQIGTAAQ